MRYIIIILALLLIGCATKNITPVDHPYWTVKTIIWDGVTWHGEYYDDRWHWEIVDDA